MAAGDQAQDTIIFCDIDGTLLNSAHQVTPRTKWAIEQVEAAGIPFVIVTARGITGTYPLLDAAGLVCPVVTYSGGAILDEARKVIYHRGFSKETAQAVVDYLDAQAFDLAWNAYALEDWVTSNKADARVQNEERIVMAEAREGTIASITHDELQKLLLICNPAQTVEIEHCLRERFPELAIMRSSDILIEVMPKGTNKAQAVRALCELWGADPACALAFGDSYNDMPMLEAVGKGYLMGNAPVELRAAFPRQTEDNDHDGIAWALVREGLLPEGGAEPFAEVCGR